MTTDTTPLDPAEQAAKQAAYAAQREARRYTPLVVVETTTAPVWCPQGGGELCCQGQCGIACVRACDAWAAEQRRVKP